MKKSIIRNYGETDFITGIRAIAATMVVIIHTSAFSEYGALGQAITNAGKYGVDIFFVISGFTIAKTYTDSQSYHSYLKRRLMRILPLYWFVIASVFLLIYFGIFDHPYWMTKFEGSPDYYNLFMHFSMLSYLDYKVANSLLGVEWTIPIEIFWYVCMPYFLFLGKTLKKVMIPIFLLLLLTAVLSLISKKIFGTSLPIKWTPFAHGHLFFIGVLTYNLRLKYKDSLTTNPILWLSLAIVLFIIASIFNFGLRGIFFGIATALIITFLTPKRMKWLFIILTLRPILYIGSISYSMYLLHFIMINFLEKLNLSLPNILNFLLVYGMTIIFSIFTYQIIEKPSNDIGRKLVSKKPT